MKPIIKTLLFTIFVPGSVAVLIPYLLSPRHVIVGALPVLGALLIAAGAAIYVSSAWSFAYHGRGTPAPIDPPKVLIVRGLNRFVRNPIYIGVLFIILGQAVLFRTWRLVVYAACFWLVAHLFVVFYEEPALKKKFGATYEQYRQSVPRWIPRFR